MPVFFVRRKESDAFMILFSSTGSMLDSVTFSGPVFSMTNSTFSLSPVLRGSGQSIGVNSTVDNAANDGEIDIKAKTKMQNRKIC